MGPPLAAGARRRAGAAMSVASLALGLVAVGVARAPGAGAFPESTVNIVGHGFGHGRGMGQFGALGYALSGSDAPTILGHYYSNTSPGSVGAPAVTVDLSRALIYSRDRLPNL